MRQLESSEPFGDLLQHIAEVETLQTNIIWKHPLLLFGCQTCSIFLTFSRQQPTEYPLTLPLFLQSTTHYLFELLVLCISLERQGGFRSRRGKMTRVFTERPRIRMTTRLHQCLYNWVCAAFPCIAFKPHLWKHALKKDSLHHLHAEITSSMKGKQHL